MSPRFKAFLRRHAHGLAACRGRTRYGVHRSQLVTTATPGYEPPFSSGPEISKDNPEKGNHTTHPSRQLDAVRSGPPRGDQVMSGAIRWVGIAALVSEVTMTSSEHNPSPITVTMNWIMSQFWTFDRRFWWNPKRAFHECP
jgi:hypothetical protein